MTIYGLIFIILLGGLAYQYIIKEQSAKLNNLKIQKQGLIQEIETKEQRLNRIDSLKQKYNKIKEQQNNTNSLYVLENQRLDVITIYNKVKEYSNLYNIDIERFTPQMNRGEGRLNLTLTGGFMDITGFINKMELLSGDIVIRQIVFENSEEDITRFSFEIKINRLQT